MKTVQQRIYEQLSGDTTDVDGSSLKTLLSGDITRVFSGLDWQVAKSPCVAFNIISTIPGRLNSDFAMIREEFYTFRIFANNFFDVADRLRYLLDRKTLLETNDAGSLRCVWDSDGPELFDENLKVRRMDSRFRIYVMPKARAGTYIIPGGGPVPDPRYGTFTSANLVANILTVNHYRALAAPYSIQISIFDSTGHLIVPDVIVGSTNSVAIDLSSYAPITGTWGYVYS